MKRAHERHEARAAGFTLIELIVVLAILGLALVLVTGYRPTWSGRLEADGVAARLAAELRLARSQAIARNHPVMFSIDLGGHRYRVDDGPMHNLPVNLRIEVLSITNERQARNVTGIRFNPDGTSTGGRITLIGAANRVAVGVDWLTGRVRLADGR